MQLDNVDGFEGILYYLFRQASQAYSVQMTPQLTTFGVQLEIIKYWKSRREQFYAVNVHLLAENFLQL